MNESGFSSSGMPYDYVVREKKTPALILKRVGLIVLYVGWSVTALILGAWLRLIAPLLAFIPLSVWMLVYFTWRYTQIEYEYSFFAGTLTVTRLAGGHRKELAVIPIRLFELFAPYDTIAEEAERRCADTVLFAASSRTSPDLYIGAWKDAETGKQGLLFMEPNEKALRIIRFYNAGVFRK